MKNFKEFSKQNEPKTVNEAKMNLIDFQIFIDYLCLSKKDFASNYNEDIIEDTDYSESDISDAMELADKCKIEKKFNEDNGIPDGFNISNLVHKAKYKNVFVFTHDVGIVETFLISSDEDLPKLLTGLE